MAVEWRRSDASSAVAAEENEFKCAAVEKLFIPDIFTNISSTFHGTFSDEKSCTLQNI
jgi:hypothetical protein